MEQLIMCAHSEMRRVPLWYCFWGLGPYIAVIKTHIDILSDFSQETIDGLNALAQKHAG
jgi:hypothetical protein